jgi:hypothetical protein
MRLDRQETPIAAVAELRRVLRSGGGAFVTGSSDLGQDWKGPGFALVWQERVEQLPTFRMHRTILPKACLQQDLTLYFVRAT